MNAVTVYSIPGSPFLGSVLLALEERKAPYEFVPWQAAVMRTEAHLAVHPFGRMPVMEHDSFRLYETQAIIRYVVEAFPGDVFVPRDIKLRARMNQLIGINDWYFFPKFSSIAGWERLIKPRLTGQPANEAAVKEVLPMGQTCVQEIAKLMGEGPYMVGGALSLADLHLAPHFHYLAMMPEGKELIAPYMAIKAWLANMRERPAMHRTMLFGI